MLSTTLHTVSHEHIYIHTHNNVYNNEFIYINMEYVNYEMHVRHLCQDIKWSFRYIGLNLRGEVKWGPSYAVSLHID